jgi:hypothetical protein
MNLADVFTVVFIILGFLLVFVAYWLLAAGLFPRLVERCAENLGRAPIKSFILGAVTFAPLLAIGLIISNKSPNSVGKVCGLGIALFAALAALLGSAGVALRIGQGLKSARDVSEPWRQVLRGGIVLALTFVLPFLGTFIVLPLAFASGFGAFLLSSFRRGKVRAPLAIPAGPEPSPSPVIVATP